MEYKTVKDYNIHKDLVMITTYENGRTIQKTIPLCDVVFTYNGKQFKGEQIIKNLAPWLFFEFYLLQYLQDVFLQLYMHSYPEFLFP